MVVMVAGLSPGGGGFSVNPRLRLWSLVMAWRLLASRLAVVDEPQTTGPPILQLVILGAMPF